MVELTEKCLTCLGCNRLENEDFKGILRCENYIEGVSKDEIQIYNNQKIIRI